MPSANGVYTLPVGYLAVTGATIQASQHNPPLEDIAAALTARLSRDGTAPMTGPLQAFAGSALAPSYTFAADNSSGFYKTINGIGITIAGTLVAEITASGVPIPDQSVTYQKIQAPSAAARLLGSNNNPALTITGAASAASLIRLVVASTSAFTTGQKKIVAGVVGTTEANGRWTITVVDSTHIDLQGSVFVNAYVSGGTIGGGVDELKLGSGLALAGDTLSASLNATLVPNFLSGLTLSTAGGSGTMAIAAGVANDTSNTVLMQLASAISKTTASWAVGTAQGGLDTGSIANSTWYHFYLIERADGTNVDVIFSLSAAAPALPTFYVLARRIGSAKTDGSGHWTAFTQVGDRFIWAAAVADASSANASSAARTALTLTVPTGIVVEALFRATIQPGVGVRLSFTSLLENDVVVSDNTADLSGSQSTTLASGSFARLTNTSAQIGYRSDTTGGGQLWESTYGWIDFRGKA